MKRKGFTLAEILIVLGVIGVVSALTLPSLMSNTSSAQIGPKLAKAVATFDQANAALLNARGVDSLLDDPDILDEQHYSSLILNHMKGSNTGTVNDFPTDKVVSNEKRVSTVTSKDGIVFAANADTTLTSSGAAHNQRIGTVVVDIDGPAGPGSPATDLFAFAWFADGSLKPFGTDGNYSWSTDCAGLDANGKKQSPNVDWACAGHVFENNLKVLYE